ncbi:MAG: hypothetical protein KIT87_29010, partial [Anaerolineae bacterium]|nr:hypothetical protein [Anaerolineae bacterium]
RGEPDPALTPPPLVGEGARGRGLQLAYALAAGRPEWLWEVLRQTYAGVEQVAHSAASDAGRPNAGYLGLDPVAGALLLGLALDGLVGCQPQFGGLVLTPRLPPDWPWLAVANLPFQGQPLSLVYLDGIVHTTHKITTAGNVELYDRADVIPGPLFAILFRREGQRRLFAATTEAAATFIRVDGRSVPVQLDAGEAVIIPID